MYNFARDSTSLFTGIIIIYLGILLDDMFNSVGFFIYLFTFLGVILTNIISKSSWLGLGAFVLYIREPEEAIIMIETVVQSLVALLTTYYYDKKHKLQ